MSSLDAVMRVSVLLSLIPKWEKAARFGGVMYNGMMMEDEPGLVWLVEGSEENCSNDPAAGPQSGCRGLGWMK